MSESGKPDPMENVRDLAAYITSGYQLDTFREMAESSASRLKSYLQAAFATVGFVNREVKISSKLTAFLDLEVDSIVCLQLNSLRLELLKSYKKIFADFDLSLKAAILKNFNVSDADLKEFSPFQTLTSCVVPAPKPQRTKYQSYEKFLSEIPSNARLISVPQARH